MPPRVPLITALTLRDRARIETVLQDARYYVGIDLGTTSSTAAVVDAQAIADGDVEAAVRVLPIRQQTENGATYSPLLASVVAEVSPGIWWVGQGAKEARRRGLLRGRQIFYSTKSEMGIGREPFYPFASSTDFDCPYKVAGRILAELAQAVAEEFGQEALRNLVVTVPASFQLSARKDTFRAADAAGMQLEERGLLDEPNAALLDYLLTAAGEVDHGEERFDFSFPRTVLVFDFGGGTCDVSILRVHATPAEQRLEIANLAIARYEQLGGDNIDTAVVERVLLPELLRQNRLESLDLTWSEKRNRILPQLIGVAEALKLGVCAEYQVQLGLRSDGEVNRALAAVQPSLQVDMPARAGRPLRALVLDQPSLTLAQLDDVLAPFLDADFLYPRDTEMNAVSSVLAPVRDALSRAGLVATDIDAVLLAGGSTLIPQVQARLQEYLPEASLLRFGSDEQTLCAVARGAALHSFFLHALSRPLLKPIAQESIGILAQQGGFAELIPRGVELPYPADGSYAVHTGLVVPRDLMREVQIVVAADGSEKVLGVERLQVQEVQSGGEPIELRWRLDANKMLEVKAALANHRDTRCEVHLENPLCAAGFRSERHRQILELEEDVARRVAAGKPRGDLVDEMESLASLYLDERRNERAIDWAQNALQASGRPSPWMLNLMGIAYDRLGAPERAEKHYREAIKIQPGEGTSRFNLSLMLKRQDRIPDALALVDEAVRLSPGEGAYQAHRASLLKEVGREEEAQAAFRRAEELLDRIAVITPFQRSWRIYVARALGDEKTAQRLEMQEKRGTAAAFDADKLPAQVGALARRDA
jgi:molecular chaperone DnaK